MRSDATPAVVLARVWAPAAQAWLPVSGYSYGMSAGRASERCCFAGFAGSVWSAGDVLMTAGKLDAVTSAIGRRSVPGSQ